MISYIPKGSFTHLTHYMILNMHKNYACMLDVYTHTLDLSQYKCGTFNTECRKWGVELLRRGSERVRKWSSSYKQCHPVLTSIITSHDSKNSNSSKLRSKRSENDHTMSPKHTHCHNLNPIPICAMTKHTLPLSLKLHNDVHKKLFKTNAEGQGILYTGVYHPSK